MRVLAISLLALFLISSLVEAVEKPFNFNETPGKLPKEVAPTEYAIRIVPNLDTFTFTGNETVKLTLRKPVRQLVLNALELKIEGASVDTKELPLSAIKSDDKNELLTLTLSSELAAGEHLLTLRFTGRINQQGQGLFYVPYQEHGSGARKVMLGTQFEATDARRFFPCWDEPAFRAHFQLTVVVPENWLAVSNMPVERETLLNDKSRRAGAPEPSTSSGAHDGRAVATKKSLKEVRFASTPPMSSYLNVLVAGELDLIESRVGATQIRVIATKGKAELGRYALESSAQILKYYNDYFGVPYPLPKLDQIAIPGGFGGAMENWGGITYYESALLFDPKSSSAETKQRVYEVIAHEMAHMWFGDLVTMAWWDNLWLNEGFASWMGSKCTAHFNPQWEVWLARMLPRDPTRRAGIAKEVAMEGDARSTTHPIQQHIETEAEANSAFDDITYKKGQSFLRMLETFLGDNIFRDGVRRYIAAHQYSNTTTADLWDALSEASNKSVAEIAAGWTEQPGFPIVKVRREADGRVLLTQERFTVNFKNAPPLLWQIPLTYSVVGEMPATLLMTDKTAGLENIPADRALKLNVNGAGNYRVEYDEPSWKLLLKSLPKLSLEDRVNLVSDSWALVQAGQAPVSLYFGLIEKLPASTDLAQCEQIINVLAFLNGLLVGSPEREKFQQYARSLLRPMFETLGWEPKPNEPLNAGRLRASLITALGDLDDSQSIAGSRERFKKFAADPASLAPDLRGPVLATVARYADDKTWNTLHELGRKTTSIEDKQNYYDALACTTDPELVKKTLAIALTDELPTSRALFLVSRVARDSGHPDLAWDFAKANMKALLAKVDAAGANRYAPSLFTFFSDTSRAGELADYAKQNLAEASAPDVAKAVDEIQFRAEFKERLASQLTGWIEKRTRGH
ncbi:MAG TPA: M1 family metallopeptidase [Candidatus Udaeobacter sp.]|jgi:aminopeptidase N|nr:M1 family metallopeptidase [Candidatus Udaeobacter sp.]